MIFALDPMSGNLMWQFAPNDPLVVRSCGKWIAIACCDGVVHILNAASGKELWKWGHNGGESHNTCETLKAPEVAFVLGGSLGMHATDSNRTQDSMIKDLPEPCHSTPSVVDDEIQHPPEPALSSDEAFARTVERNVAAEQA